MGKQLILLTIILISFISNTAVGQPPPPTPPVCSLQVVFHILHQNGPENISDSQIVDAVRILNEDFSKTNADTADIIPQFKSIADNAYIHFALPTIDPQGNATNGIDRIQTDLTFNDTVSENSKINQWPRNKYVNIWVTAKLQGGVAGYSLAPSSVDGAANAHSDGIIILNDYIGSIGTSDPSHKHALTNIIGHYFGLLPLSGNAPFGTCGDDGISDTPITKGYSSCPTTAQSKICHPPLQDGPNDTGVVENFQNFMDYSYCACMFTSGQCQAMRNVLNSPIADRNQLCGAIGVGIDEVTIANNDFSLYPNPANCSVQLSYKLMKESTVRIELLDALGRNVLTVADGKQAVGSHSTTVNTSAIPAGIYLVRMTADGVSTSKRLIINR